MAMSHADKIVNVARSRSVAAFAVYKHTARRPSGSKLPMSIWQHVCAWLIATHKPPADFSTGGKKLFRIIGTQYLLEMIFTPGPIVVATEMLFRY